MIFGKGGSRYGLPSAVLLKGVAGHPPPESFKSEVLGNEDACHNMSFSLPPLPHPRSRCVHSSFVIGS